MARKPAPADPAHVLPPSFELAEESCARSPPMIRDRVGFRRWLMRGSPLAPSSLLYSSCEIDGDESLGRGRRGSLINNTKAATDARII